MRSPFVLVMCLVVLSCGPTDTAKLYRTSGHAPSIAAEDITALKALGPTVIDKGVNFGVYSEHAERIEILFFDDPESTEPTRFFPIASISLPPTSFIVTGLVTPCIVKLPVTS